MSPSKFADEIGVQRSSISHILSERNKPSLEFVQKILNTFPEINTDWLLTGKNTMINQEPDLFSVSKNETHNNNMISNQSENNSLFTNVNNQSSTSFVTNVNSEIPVNESKNQVKEINTKEVKSVEKIVMFYNDQTFKEYKSEENV